jgi:hypothetical protein
LLPFGVVAVAVAVAIPSTSRRFSTTNKCVMVVLAVVVVHTDIHCCYSLVNSYQYHQRHIDGYDIVLCVITDVMAVSIYHHLLLMA